VIIEESGVLTLNSAAELKLLLNTTFVVLQGGDACHWLVSRTSDPVAESCYRRWREEFTDAAALNQ
jgi:hypothetical protein